MDPNNRAPAILACFGKPDPVDMKVYCPCGEEAFDDEEKTEEATVTESFFSSTYEEARQRFVLAAERVGARLSRYPVAIEGEAEDALTIDVAILGQADSPTLVISSGVHGVEGFLGSAIQLAMLHAFGGDAARHVCWVFVHAVNPFGFSQIRRFNESNVDLNRNFLSDGCSYSGASASYSRLNEFLNPTTPPPIVEPFRLKAFWNIARYGLGTLKQSIAQGQYDYPCGIFFGGEGPSQAFRIIEENISQWIGQTKHVLHVDFHSGLGAFGDYKLLLAELTGSDNCEWYERVFGRNVVEATDPSAPTAYRASGSMGEWLQNYFVDRNYRFVTAEFGTYGPVRVLGAIRAENRAHHFGAETSRMFRNAKRELLECFCPTDRIWRRKAIASGLGILSRGSQALAADDA